MSRPATESPPEASPTTTRWLMRLILIVAAAAQLSRILQVQSSTGELPFMSANDRSRWCTIAALAVHGSYEIDEVLEIRDPATNRRTWYTIDLVQHRGPDGKQHFYSSKPPLLPTLYAGVYVAIRAVTGATLMNDPFFVARVMLILVNALPLLAFWWLLLRWVEREQLGLWGGMVFTVFVTWGTYLSTFVTTLNNHLPAALAVGVSLWCIDRIVVRSDRRSLWFALCGLSTSFGATNELPALSWVAAAGAILLLTDLRKTVLVYVPALLPIALAFFATNYAAHGEFVPAYAHRGLGPQIATIEIPQLDSMQRLDPMLLREQLAAVGIECSDSSIIRQARRDDIFELWDPESQVRRGLQRAGTSSTAVGVYEWSDWYDYPGSYWTSDRKQGVDRGEPSRALYIFHCLLGHHGIFSLTPFWFVAVLGCVTVWRQKKTINLFHDKNLLIAGAIVATSIVAIGFYLARPLEDRNYGGVSSGFRWAFWLSPLWLWLSIHGLRCVQSRLARGCVELLLVISIFSACFAWDNPWTSPWPMQYFEYLGWL